MTVKYSPIAPIQLLEQLHSHSLLSNYLLLLAHDVLEYPKEYAAFIDDWRMIYHERHQQECTIIMDNGVVERGSPVPLEDLMEAASLVEATIVVGPDVIGDDFATRKLMMAQGDDITTHYDMMKIPQGQWFDEIIECIEWLNDKYPCTPGVPSYWGIPRWFTNKLGSRKGAIDYINAICPNAKIHLLGMSHNIIDDIECTKLLNVIGIDSANPLVLGMNEHSIDGEDIPHLDRGDYWVQADLTPLMRHNVEYMHNVLCRL